ncbi:glycosyltransferase [Kitasatospora aburaviensis]
MRVLHVVTGLASGGAERQLQLLLRHLPAHQHCEVAALTNPGAVAAALSAEGVTVHHLAMRGNRDLGALPRLVRLIRAGRYDLVHTHLYRAQLYGRLAARLAGVRAVVSTEHSLHAGVIEGRPVTRGVKGLYLLAERLGTTTVAVSRQVAQTLHAWGVPQARIELIPNGIDAARYHRPDADRAADQARLRTELGLPPESWVVGGVGRLVPGKRFHVLVEAVAELDDGARLVLVGEGPERAALERRAAELGLGERLVLTGERDDVPELLAALDVLAAPRPRRPSASACWRAWRPASRSATAPARRWTNCRPPPPRRPAGSPPTPPPTPRRCATCATSTTTTPTRCPGRRPSATTTSPGWPPTSAPSTTAWPPPEPPASEPPGRRPGGPAHPRSTPCPNRAEAPEAWLAAGGRSPSRCRSAPPPAPGTPRWPSPRTPPTPT